MKTLLNKLPKGRITRWGFLAGLLLALVFLAAATAEPKSSGKQRPFKGTGIISFNPTSQLGGTFGVVGSATHLGEFVGQGTYEVTDVSPDGSKVYMHVTATWTAANGDTIEFDMPEWVSDYSATPSSSGVANVIGGTGRFAGASGSIFSEISPAHGAPGVTQIITSEGTISY